MNFNQKKVTMYSLAAAGLTLAILYALFDSPGTRAQEETVEEDVADSNPFAGPGRLTLDELRARPEYYETKGVLKMFRQWAKYPPNSRPLENNMEDRIEYDIVKLSPIPLMGKRSDGTYGNSSYRCSLQPLKKAFTEGDSILVALYCGKPGNFAPLEIKDVRIRAQAPKRSWNIPRTAIAVNDDGLAGDERAGDFVYTLSYRPGQSDWGNMFMDVDFEIPGEEKPGEYSIETAFFVSPIAPARFTGNVFEKIENGSLVLEAEIRVKKTGDYTIYGNLKNPEDWLATAYWTGRLEEGTRRIPLLFFGKILNEKKADGPYFLTGLRGTRDNDPVTTELLTGPSKKVAAFLNDLRRRGYREPLRQVIPSWTDQYRTAEYRYTDFSPEEWKSDYKTRRIHELEQLGYMD